MKTILGFTLIALGAIAGLWLGAWVLAIGGIVQFIDAVKNDVNAFGIACGIIRFFLAAPVGWITFILCAGAGTALLDKEIERGCR